ncbi:MAG: nitroreductase family protein [Eubacterium sp.]|nr:nitroreductase family protein [Eubacterium sp.]
MDKFELMRQRHSVRSYLDKDIDAEHVLILRKAIDRFNKISGLNMQFIENDADAFDCRMARYGKFEGVKNYIALVGPKGPNLDFKCGYYGEHIVLLAQSLGLNTCWVGLTFNKTKTVFSSENNEKLAAVIAIGYGKTQGVPHKSKKLKAVSDYKEGDPEWFKRGVEAALLAPTAINQQKFNIVHNVKKVKLRPGIGFFTKMDMGIVKYHFELGAGKENFVWSE